MVLPCLLSDVVFLTSFFCKMTIYIFSGTSLSFRRSILFTNSLLVELFRPFLTVVVIVISSVNSSRVILTGISDVNRSSYRTFEGVGRITDPCGTPMLRFVCLIPFSDSRNMFLSAR